jgi:hypothetical protein
MDGRRDERVRRAREHLLGVLLCDAAACSALTAAAFAARTERSSRVLGSIAGVAIASFVPGVIAVVRERDLHDHRRPVPHSMASAVLLFMVGMVINTAGTVRLIPQARSSNAGPRALALDVGLLIGGDLIGVPYLLLVRALHREQP